MVFTHENFDVEVLQSTLPVMVDVYTTLCGPCQRIAPFVEQLAVEFEGRMKIGKMDAEENGERSQMLGIRSVPAFLFFKDGQEQVRLINPTREEIRLGLAKYVETISIVGDKVYDGDKIIGYQG
jgi:thioredoxin 1